MSSITYDPEIDTPPKHLDVSFFEEVLETALRTAQVKLLAINCSLGSSAGENYCSKIYRVNIQFQVSDQSEQQISFIVKTIPRLEAVEFVEDLQIYLKEKITYYEVLPRLELLTKCRQRFGPKLYQCLKEPESTLVFEDLSQSGYVMASRESGLDERHCGLVMERLAEFHATSMVLAKLDPQLIDAYGHGMLSPHGLAKDDGMLMRFFTGNGNELHSLVNSWPGYERIADKIAKYLANQRNHLVRSQAPLEQELKVLNHGDLWVNNILFKYNATSQKPEDLIFIDFQLSIWGSPGIDLNYFFYTSLNLEVLKHKRPQLLKIYHARLVETLLKLNMKDLPVPSYEQVLEEVHRRAGFGFFANYGIFPTVSQDKAQTADNSLENFQDVDFTKQKVKQMFGSKRLEQTLRYTLPEFERAGVFD